VKRFAPSLQAALEAGAAPVSPSEKQKTQRALALTGVVVVAVLGFAFFAPNLADRGADLIRSVFVPAVAVQFALSASSAFRRGHKWMALFFALFAVMMALWTLVVWEQNFVKPHG
jgi:hypothetical protein